MNVHGTKFGNDKDKYINEIKLAKSSNEKCTINIFSEKAIEKH